MMRTLKVIWLRFLIYITEQDIALAEDAYRDLGKELPAMHRKRATLLSRYFDATAEKTPA
jgi:hypothetical protein